MLAHATRVIHSEKSDRIVESRTSPMRLSEPRPREPSLRYFITFSCYGARLHGDESGSLDRHHNLIGTGVVQPDAKRFTAERRAMLQSPYLLDQAGREIVLEAIQRHLCAPRLEPAGGTCQVLPRACILDAEAPREN